MSPRIIRVTHCFQLAATSRWWATMLHVGPFLGATIRWVDGRRQWITGNSACLAKARAATKMWSTIHQDKQEPDPWDLERVSHARLSLAIEHRSFPPGAVVCSFLPPSTTILAALHGNLMGPPKAAHKPSHIHGVVQCTSVDSLRMKPSDPGSHDPTRAPDRGLTTARKLRLLDHDQTLYGTAVARQLFL
ncbi:hypothetical protein N657DRAFT_492400 [Parathielavia appendiculata]|uniref:Uncharacterized protein n=1 Tax=Parathielavia appendiculata TaxID=2587402 RepID=A0AAN6TWS5_9PEZI|nr:hypothetical protein N657DRAFT_492400 [Parathielavia appendiculata]